MSNNLPEGLFIPKEHQVSEDSQEDTSHQVDPELVQPWFMAEEQQDFDSFPSQEHDSSEGHSVKHGRSNSFSLCQS